MRSLATLAAVVVALALATASAAGTSSATTTIDPLTPPTSGQTTNVTFTLFTTAPVVPYEYALQNTCVYPTKLSGHYTLGQHDAIVTWTDTDANGNPMVTMPVYLQSVPSGSTCKVSLMDGNVVVKGSTVSYTVS